MKDSRRIHNGNWEKCFVWLTHDMHGKMVWLRMAYKRMVVDEVRLNGEWDNFYSLIMTTKYYEYGNLFDLIKGDKNGI